MIDRELPLDVIASIDVLIDAFRAGNKEEKVRISEGVDYTFSFAFFMYAGRAAVESVREKKPELLERGLLALAVENLAFDARDSLIALVKLYNTSLKFPIDPNDLFESIASASVPPFNGTLSRFISSDSKSLAQFGLKESTPPTPFNYETLKKDERKRPYRLRFLLRRMRHLPVLRQIIGL